MTTPINKQTFLTDLRQRNQHNCEIVQTEFVPLDRAARSMQPAQGEWCVDQCFQHLILAFKRDLPQALKKLQLQGSADHATYFKPSWVASLRFSRYLYEPRSKAPTYPAINPSDHYFPDVLNRFFAQKKQLDEMLTQANQADLQQRCWYLGFVPINLGDFLAQFVMHDELHIDQAQRALAAYRLGNSESGS